MARDVKRAFLTSLEFSTAPAVDEDAWELDEQQYDPQFPQDDTLVSTGLTLDGVSSMESLVDALKEARSLGFTQDATHSIVEQLTILQSNAHVLAPLLPALEAIQAFPANAVDVTMESLSQSIKDTLKAVLVALAKFWAMLTDYVQELQSSTKVVRVRAELAWSRLRAVAGRYPIENTVDATRLIPLLSTDRKRATDARNIQLNLRDMQRQLAYTRLQYLPMVVRLTGRFIDQFELWGKVDPNEWLFGLNELAMQYAPVQALDASIAFTDREVPFFSIDARVTPPMPGYKSLVVIPAPTDTFTAAVDHARALQSARVVLHSTRAPDNKRDASMPTLPLNEMESMLAQVRQLADEVDRMVQDDVRRTLRELTVRLERLVNSNLEVPDGTIHIFQAGIAYARAISRWAKEPYVAVVFHAIVVCNNTVRMCNLHTRAYKQEPKPKENQK